MIPAKVLELRDRGALFVSNHSAGKDSQAMDLLLRELVPHDQIIRIHADLGDIEWPGNVEHIRRYGNLPLIIAKAFDKTGAEKGLLDYVEHRGKWMSPGQRYCTSDWKRGPITREIRRYLAENPRFGGLVVDCQGMRADESPDRKKLLPFEWIPYEKENGKPTGYSLRARGNQPGREWYSWLPIHDLSRDEVFARIRAAGEEPHPVYAQGMSRLSCSFCIMASKGDLRTAAQLRPDLYRRYVELERRIGHTFSMSRKPLEEITGITIDQPEMKEAA